MAIHPASLSDSELLDQCTQRRTRRSGPGGQHRNKVESAIILTHQPTQISAEANERRSQHDNRTRAIFRLRSNLALGIRQHREGNASPSELWQSRCHRERIAINPVHQDFPALLAEALDVIEMHQGDVKAAAEQLGCSPTQLIKLVKLETRGLHVLNLLREKRGLAPLR